MDQMVGGDTDHRLSDWREHQPRTTVHIHQEIPTKKEGVLLEHPLLSILFISKIST